MKYSYLWLKELTNTKKTPGELTSLVMEKGFELEETIELGAKFKGFVVGQILEISKHPKADRLQLVKVNIGEEKLNVVCGAWNIKVGDKVPVATVGAVVPQNKITVEAREVRGQMSRGMLCAEDELGLGKDHSGIMLLDKQAEVGESLAKALGLDDVVIDFSILPNRSHDCLSHIGMAREICAMEGRKYEEKSGKLAGANKGKQLSITIRDKKLCPRYIGTLLSGIKIGPSPKWMQSRLVACGMEPINNVVDITNYVMLETGNPLHAFDAEKVKGKKEKAKGIVVRRADKQEKIELLDGKNLELSDSDLVIADEEKILALAGIKGGKYSGISRDTQTIILESANFNAYNIRKTRQRYSLLTESQARYEKSISPVPTEKATQRAIELLGKYAGANVQEIVDVNYAQDKPHLVKLEIGYVDRLLGYTVKEEQITRILTNLGFSLKAKTKTHITFSVPYWRLDIEGQEDLIEEVGRIIGYDKIQEQPIIKEVSLPYVNKEREFEWKLKDMLSAMGFDEVKNYSFYGDKDAELFSGADGHLALENPLTPEHTMMRRTLLPGILRNMALNEHNFQKVALCEIGRVYSFVEGRLQEEPKIGGALQDNCSGGENSFYELKGKLVALLGALIPGKEIVFRRIELADSRSFTMARTAAIYLGPELVGAMGEVGKSAMKQYGMKKRACMFELDFQAIFQAATRARKHYKPLRKYPEVKRDISLFVDYKTETADVVKTIESASGKLLLQADLFDVYQDKDKNRKSLAFHLSFGADDRTLESAQVDVVFNKIVSQLEQDLDAEIRK